MQIVITNEFPHCYDRCHRIWWNLICFWKSKGETKKRSIRLRCTRTMKVLTSWIRWHQTILDFGTFLSYRNIQMIIIRGNRIHMKLWNETIVFTLHIFSICFNGGAFGLQSLPFGVHKYGMPVLWFIIFTLAGDKDSRFTLWQIWRFYSISHMVVIAIFFVLVLSTFHRVCSI